MSDIVTLSAEIRGRAGKGGAREVRRAGRIPAIIYGEMQEPLMVALDAVEVNKQLRRPGFMSHVFEINVAGRKERVLPREVQQDPVTDQPLHVDFLRLSATTRVRVEVPIRFENEGKAPGLRMGGVLNVVLHTIEVVCTPDTIPEAIVVDLSGLEMGDVIHLDAIKLPAGVELGETDPNATIASVAAPSSGEAAKAATEGETAEKTA